MKRTAEVLRKGIADAEKCRTVEGRPADGVVSIKPTQIKTLPELFQIRRFFYGVKHIHNEHVKKLARAIGIVGELDPPVVVKLGVNWVCLDGHHRIEAYKQTGWRNPITCVWFGGTVQEAVDEAVLLNGKDRLNITQGDRLERAWELVQLGAHSKAEIVKLCGVGDGSVSHMRRIKKTYDLKDDAGAKLFRKRLGGRLEDASWTSARLAYVGVEPKARDDEEEAAKLAKRINSRMTNLLSRNPRVTARALEIYNAELPNALMEAWQERDLRLKNAGDIDGWKPGDQEADSSREQLADL